MTLILIFGILASCWSLPADAVLPADAEKSPLGGDQTITSLTIEAPLTPSSLPPPTTQTRAPASPTPSPMPDLPCTPDYCSYWGHFWMSRPILPTDYDHVDSSYRYGSTQEGARPTHHGVE
ncbi:MAG: hypothetical protein JW757_06640, partial [Anaerolineales bacterium]|nr:hypothetical protein [Anaerolineales bacterium]